MVTAVAEDDKPPVPVPEIGVVGLVTTPVRRTNSTGMGCWATNSNRSRARSSSRCIPHQAVVARQVAADHRAERRAGGPLLNLGLEVAQPKCHRSLGGGSGRLSRSAWA